MKFQKILIGKKSLFILGGLCFLLILLVSTDSDSFSSWAKKIDFLDKNEKVEQSQETLKTSLEFQKTLRLIASSLRPSVVFIRAKREAVQNDVFGGSSDFEDLLRKFFGEGVPKSSPSMATGSGFIISKDGYLLTNAHVVEDASSVEVLLNNQSHALKAEIIGADKKTDIALLKINAKKAGLLTPAPLGDSSKVREGDLVVAIGSPFGFIGSMAFGIISASGRNETELTMDKDAPFKNYIQSDVAINPGNSGGPLVNIRGQVIGINSAIFSTSGGSIGISFSIPINIAKDISSQLVRDGKISRGTLGISIQSITSDLAKYYGLKEEEGALIASVKKGSSAAKAGLKAGDIIIQVNGQKVKSPSFFVSNVGSKPIGTNLKLLVLRGNKKISVMVQVGKNQENDDEEKSTKDTDQSSKSKLEKLGMSVMSIEKAREIYSNIPSSPKTGIMVLKIQPDSIFNGAGIKPGDVIVSLNGKVIKTIADINQAISNRNKYLFYLNRNGNYIYIAVSN